MDHFSLLRNMEQLRLSTPLSIPDHHFLDPSSDIGSRSKVAREEAALEAKIIHIITGGSWTTLKPNSGTAVPVGEHYVCVGFHEDKQAGFRIWEWHGHMLLLDDEEGFIPEYVYGNFFQPMEVRGDAEDGGVVNGIGLGGIIDGDDGRQEGSILRRNVHVNSIKSLSNGVDS